MDTNGLFVPTATSIALYGESMPLNQPFDGDRNCGV